MTERQPPPLRRHAARAATRGPVRPAAVRGPGRGAGPGPDHAWTRSRPTSIRRPRRRTCSLARPVARAWRWTRAVDLRTPARAAGDRRIELHAIRGTRRGSSWPSERARHRGRGAGVRRVVLVHRSGGRAPRRAATRHRGDRRVDRPSDPVDTERLDALVSRSSRRTCCIVSRSTRGRWSRRRKTQGWRTQAFTW